MPLFVSETQEQASRNVAVKFQVPGNAARISDRASQSVFVEGGSRSGAVFPEQGDGSIREVGKCGGQERDAIVEAADSTFQQGLCVLGQSKKKSDAWSCVRRVRDGVVIEAQARGYGETPRNCPLVSDKPG